MCNEYRCEILKLCSLDKKFNPYLKDEETGKMEFIEDIVLKLNYSKALSEIYDITQDQYSKYSEAK